MCTLMKFSFLIFVILLQHKGELFQIRLVNGPVDNMGYVEVLLNGQWGVVCDDGWYDHKNCQVVCFHLKSSGGIVLPEPGWEKSNNPIFLDEVECVGNEDKLSDCTMANFYQHDCSHKEDVACECEAFNTSSNKNGSCLSENHRITPIDENTPWVGRAEVLLDGFWKSICDDDWEDIDATIFCDCYQHENKSLPYYSISNKALRNLPPIIMGLDSVRCSYPDAAVIKNLWDCPVSKAAGRCAGPDQTAGVACGPLPEPAQSDIPDVTLECNGGKLTACFGGTSYKMDNSFLSLEPECTSLTTYNLSSGACARFEMDKCPTTKITVTTSEKRFCFTLLYKPAVQSASSWKRDVCCYQSKNGTAYLSGQPITGNVSPRSEPLVPPTHPSRHVVSTVNYTLACYLNSAFSGDTVTVFPHGAKVYCRLSAKVWDQNLYVVVPSCNFYGNRNGTPSFNFLHNKCPTTETLSLSFYNFDSHSWGFRFNAPKFPSTDELYISCNAYLCDITLDPRPYCDRSCMNVRRKRDVPSPAFPSTSAEGHPSAGPFLVSSGVGPILMDTSTEPEPESADDSSESAFIVQGQGQDQDQDGEVGPQVPIEAAQSEVPIQIMQPQEPIQVKQPQGPIQTKQPQVPIQVNEPQVPTQVEVLTELTTWFTRHETRDPTPAQHTQTQPEQQGTGWMSELLPMFTSKVSSRTGRASAIIEVLRRKPARQVSALKATGGATRGFPPCLALLAAMFLLAIVVF